MFKGKCAWLSQSRLVAHIRAPTASCKPSSPLSYIWVSGISWSVNLPNKVSAQVGSLLLLLLPVETPAWGVGVLYASRTWSSMLCGTNFVRGAPATQEHSKWDSSEYRRRDGLDAAAAKVAAQQPWPQSHSSINGDMRTNSPYGCKPLVLVSFNHCNKQGQGLAQSSVWFLS